MTEVITTAASCWVCDVYALCQWRSNRIGRKADRHYVETRGWRPRTWILKYNWTILVKSIIFNIAKLDDCASCDSTNNHHFLRSVSFLATSPRIFINTVMDFRWVCVLIRRFFATSYFNFIAVQKLRLYNRVLALGFTRTVTKLTLNKHTMISPISNLYWIVATRSSYFFSHSTLNRLHSKCGNLSSIIPLLQLESSTQRFQRLYDAILPVVMFVRVQLSVEIFVLSLIFKLFERYDSDYISCNRKCKFQVLIM